MTFSGDQGIVLINPLACISIFKSGPRNRISQLELSKKRTHFAVDEYVCTQMFVWVCIYGCMYIDLVSYG